MNFSCTSALRTRGDSVQFVPNSAVLIFCGYFAQIIDETLVRNLTVVLR